MRTTNQGGSLAGFIIIGVLLALVLIGGLYGLNRYNAQRTADETVKQEEAKTKTTDTSDKATNDTKKTGTADSSTQTQTNTAKTGSSATSTPAPSGSSTQLPHTGPSDIAFSLIAVAALAFASAHYVRSRSRA